MSSIINWRAGPADRRNIFSSRCAGWLLGDSELAAALKLFGFIAFVMGWLYYVAYH
jgi:hypothetical protein